MHLLPSDGDIITYRGLLRVGKPAGFSFHHYGALSMGIYSEQLQCFLLLNKPHVVEEGWIPKHRPPTAGKSVVITESYS